MSAQPLQEYDPEAILRALPEEWRPVFLAQYHEAWEAAREPGEYHRLPEVLNLWWLNSIAFADPEYEKHAQEAAQGVGEFVAFEEAVPDWEERLARAPRR
ncbi:DUF6247 family protein [Microbispora sp. ATCC PTA-5024]|uniref:DUF6247 family protein n=1 Tax=Microbispora sp. ATCC PTA-5024 TaxID=316330 RepID=UPI0003DB84E6|nr:DUF6247 family protein [Microbispora sp. ATCC PTA-5024]ETK31481.1 hypothetical protein MPTA5024_34700 [Microbispora sp. ATCC PTA-5024]